MSDVLNSLRRWGEFVKFSHTVFALPFALAAMAVAARDQRGWPGWRAFGLILAASLTGVQDATTVHADTGHIKEQFPESVRKVTFSIDFFVEQGRSVEEWLDSMGFTFDDAVKNPNLIELEFTGNALVAQAKQPVRGFLYNESVDLRQFTTVRLVWGVLKYPQGASYEKNINNEALMVYIFFGDDKLASGSLLIPDSPYFLGLYLGKDDTVGKVYKGRYYHQGGRFICLGNPAPGQTVVSELNLIEAFRSYFEKDHVPVISGISLSVDTSASGDGGKASAFIKSIEFFE